MTIVVAGLTGNTGSVVAESLLAQGVPVRGLVRSAAKAAALRERGVELVEASLSDAASLAQALAGASSAYLLLPPLLHSERTLEEQARLADAIASALEQVKLAHVVFLSSIGAHFAEGTGPIQSVAYAERRLARVKGTAFTFLRAAYFMENYASSLGGLASGTFQTFIDPARVFPQVATADIGKVAARRLLEGAKRSEVIELAGPADASVADAARTFGELLGKPLTLQVGPVSAMADVLASYGLSRDMGRLYAEMTQRLNEGRLTYEGGHRFERGTTPLASVARKLLKLGAA